jgi:glycosyltransferase involved in cell wall biosynthesis
VRELVRVLDELGHPFEVVAVSDGSTDGSEHSIEGVDRRVRVVVLPSNQGKGEALRVGMGQSAGTRIGFIDADGDIPPALMGQFLAVSLADDPDMVIGSKTHPKSENASGGARRLLSALWQVVTRILFQLPVKDSQVGIKLFRADVVHEVLPLTVRRGFSFDLELLVLAHDAGYRDIAELPIVLGDRVGSTVSFRTALAMGRDLLVLFWRLRVRRPLGARRSETRRHRMPGDGAGHDVPPVGGSKVGEGRPSTD